MAYDTRCELGTIINVKLHPIKLEDAAAKGNRSTQLTIIDQMKTKSAKKLKNMNSKLRNGCIIL